MSVPHLPPPKPWRELHALSLRVPKVFVAVYACQEMDIADWKGRPPETVDQAMGSCHYYGGSNQSPRAASCNPISANVNLADCTPGRPQIRYWFSVIFLNYASSGAAERWLQAKEQTGRHKYADTCGKQKRR